MTDIISTLPCSEEDRALLLKEVEKKYLPERLRFAAKAFRFRTAARLNRDAKRSNVPFAARYKALLHGTLAGVYRNTLDAIK